MTVRCGVCKRMFESFERYQKHSYCSPNPNAGNYTRRIIKAKELTLAQRYDEIVEDFKLKKLRDSKQK